MNPETLQTTNELAWEGLISGTTALAMVAVIAVVAGWFLWRERHAVGGKTAIAFWVLRVAAFGCVLWMLAGPTRLRIDRHTTSQSIAIFADGSESMDVVDPPVAADAVRWQLAVDASSDDSAVVNCDRLAVALGAALADCTRFTQLIDEHRPTKQLENAAASIAVAVDRSKTHANSLAASIDDDADRERATRLAALVEGPISESLAEVRDALEKSDELLGDEFTMHVDQLVESVNGAKRRALVLAGDLAQRTADDNPSDEIVAMSRREKTAKALDVVEKGMAEGLADNVTVERYRFDRTAMPVTIDSGWETALERIAVDSDDVAPAAEASADGASDVQTTGGAATNVSSVLERLTSQRAGQSTRLAVLITDGRHNDLTAQQPQELAAQLGNLPVYVVPIGNTTLERDVLLHRVEAPTAVSEKDSAVVDVIVTGFDCEGQTSNVVLRHDGKEVDRKPIVFESGRGDYRVRFIVAAKELGWQEYVVEVEPVDEETNTANNFQPVSFEVVRDHVRVLLADSVARWEYQYLSQLFRREPHVKCDQLLFFPRLAGTGELARRPEFPRDVEGWAKYDVVILGDIGPQQLPEQSQRALDEFVQKRGGNLILIAGSNSMPAAFAADPLMDLLPVELTKDVVRQQGYTLDLTQEGGFNSALLIADSPAESRAAWQSIYRRFLVFGLSDYCKPKPTARTLIEAISEQEGERDASGAGDVEHAFLCWQRAGAGRVVYLAAPDTYRLRWRRGDRMHHRFWGQFLRWVTAATTGAGNDLVRLQTDRTRYAKGEAVEVTAWLKDPSGRPIADEVIQAEARTFNDDAKSIELTADPELAGRYTGTFHELPAGAYQIGVRGKVVDDLLAAGKDAADATVASATITVRDADSVEMLNTQCNRALLEQIAEMTGGQVIPPTAMSEVLELVSFTPEVSESIQRRPLWNRWSNLFIVLGCLFTEWIVRKGKGLV
jgi:hypothetical protein